MEVTQLPESEFATMRTKLKPVVDKYAKEFGEGTMQEMMGELTKIRGK